MRHSLNEKWEMKEAPLAWDTEMAGHVARSDQGWFQDLSIPCDVHMPLIAAGIIKDPVLADYSYDCTFIEERSWWFRRSFEISTDFTLYDRIELVLESLDVHADVFVNGAWVGHQASAHFPFRKDIKPWLQAGQNQLLVRLTTGLERVSDRDLAEIDFMVSTEAGNGCPDRGDKRRAFLRKPTYVFGWDWCPRIATCGITKPVYLEFHQTTALRQVRVTTMELQQRQLGWQARLKVEVELELLDMLATADADLGIEISYGEETITRLSLQDQLLTSGINWLELETTIDKAEMWWPHDLGDQPLYQIKVTADCRGHQQTWPAQAFGIRTVTMDIGRQPDGKRTFAFIVNGIKIFAKGANWIPADSIYARVSDARYDNLVEQARQAHFNMLRIWGGGLYERDAFYQACDRKGILVWQDLMFGCSTYPDHRQDFYDLVSHEIDYQSRRLRHHPCLALLCGNNENHWLYGERVPLSGSRPYGLNTANHLLPAIARSNCPDIPIWNSSPYGGAEPNAADTGDVHHWRECMMNPDMAKRIEPKEFDQVKARFVSEYGYPGPCPRKTIETYFDGQPIDRDSRIWKLHNNTFEKYTVEAGIRKHYTDDALDLDGYLLHAGLVQSLMLGRSLESLRGNLDCFGALFWMFNDCWGEVGWTIIDYDLRRKIAFYGVKRAFAPQKLILRLNQDEVILIGCNDGPDHYELSVQAGYVPFAGDCSGVPVYPVALLPHSRRELLRLPLTGNLRQGIFFARAINQPVFLPAILAAHDFRQLDLPAPDVAVVKQEDQGRDRLVTVKAGCYCHAVHFNTEDDDLLEDHYFDLLPGQQRQIRILGAAGRNFTARALLPGHTNE